MKLLMLVLLAFPVFAEEAQSPKSAVSLQAMIERANTSNPGVLAAKARWEAARHTAGAAKAWPDPELKISKAFHSIETAGGPITGGIKIAQPIPYPGKRALSSQAAMRRAEAAKQGYLAHRWKVRAAVTRTHNRLYYLRSAEKILGEQVELLRHFSRVAEKKYAVRRGPQAMVFRAQAELSRMQNQVTTNQQEQASTRTELNALLNHKPWAKIGPLNAPPHPSGILKVETLRARALAHRPELLAARALSQSGQAERRLARREFFPDFLLGYEYTSIGTGSGLTGTGRDASAATVGISIPLWGRRDRHRAAQGREAAADFNAQNVENQTLSLVEDLTVRVDTSQRLHAVDQNTVLPQIRAALKATLSGYESDAVSFLDLLDVERTLLELEIKHIRHLTMYHDMIAQLERAIGEEL
jgi:cobalt-zinc-cadmium efflux system outer membrane protein